MFCETIWGELSSSENQQPQSINQSTMTRSTLQKLTQRSIRQILSKPNVSRISLSSSVPSFTASTPSTNISRRAFTTQTPLFKGITPESSDPAPKESEDHVKLSAPTEISTEYYHEQSDAFMDRLVAELEALQEEREDVDVEFSVRKHRYPA